MAVRLAEAHWGVVVQISGARARPVVPKAAVVSRAGGATSRALMTSDRLAVCAWSPRAAACNCHWCGGRVWSDAECVREVVAFAE